MSERDFNAPATTRYGTFLYNRFDRYVGRSIELYRECAEYELELLRRIAGHGCVAASSSRRPWCATRTSSARDSAGGTWGRASSHHDLQPAHLLGTAG